MVTHHPVLAQVGKVVGNSISFQHSDLQVATAGSPAASRSADFTCMHLSEVAFWPHPEAMTASLQCVPEQFQSFVAIESTANGKVGDGELFYVIENGVRLTAMPAWGGGSAHDEQESWKLVHFIRHLPQLTDEEKAEMKKLNPKSSAELREEQEEEDFLKGEDSHEKPISHHHR